MAVAAACETRQSETIRKIEVVIAIHLMRMARNFLRRSVLFSVDMCGSESPLATEFGVQRFFPADLVPLASPSPDDDIPSFETCIDDWAGSARTVARASVPYYSSRDKRVGSDDFTGSFDPVRRLFSVTEWRVIAQAHRDPLFSIFEAHDLWGMARRALGNGILADLAQQRLEALRHTCVLLRHRSDDLIARERDALREAGFSETQIAALRSCVKSADADAEVVEGAVAGERDQQQRKDAG